MYSKDKTPADGFKIYTIVLAAALVILFVLSIAPSASASMEKMSTMSGQVIAVDPRAGTLTIKGDVFSPGQYTFVTGKTTSVTSCAQNDALGDIGKGQDVTVTYSEKDGKLFADKVEKKLTLALACIYP